MKGGFSFPQRWNTDRLQTDATIPHIMPFPAKATVMAVAERSHGAIASKAAEIPNAIEARRRGLMNA